LHWLLLYLPSCGDITPSSPLTNILDKADSPPHRINADDEDAADDDADDNAADDDADDDADINTDNINVMQMMDDNADAT
jgi:hypothetical protein